MIRFTRLIRFTLGVGLVLAAFSTPAWAKLIESPEIDPGSTVGAMALLSLGVLMLADRRRKK